MSEFLHDLKEALPCLHKEQEHNHHIIDEKDDLSPVAERESEGISITKEIENTYQLPVDNTASTVKKPVTEDADQGSHTYHNGSILVDESRGPMCPNAVPNCIIS